MIFYKENSMLYEENIDEEESIYTNKQKYLEKIEKEHLLLKKGHTTPLHLACKHRDYLQVEILVKTYHLDVNAKDVNGNTPLFCIFEEPIDEDDETFIEYLVHFLVHHHADFNVINKLGQTLLHILCQYELHYIIRVLIHDGAKVNVIDTFGKTPLYYACERGHIKNLVVLVVQSVDEEVKTSVNNCPIRPLHIVCQANYDTFRKIEIIEYLTKNGEDINCQHRYFGYTPLHIAVQKDSHMLVSYLLNSGANPKIRQTTGQLPQYYAKCDEIRDLFSKYCLE